MTNTVTEHGDVALYLAAIREALDDLQPAERDDLLEDLEAHLYEVLAESEGGTLEASLGSPLDYAAELRASAGLEAAGGRRRTRLAAVSQAGYGFAGRPATRSVGRFLLALRPAWWLARGWLVLMAVVIITDGQRSGAGQRSLWLPTYYGTAARAAVITLLVVAASAWVGTRTHAFTRPAKRAVFAFNGLVIAFAIVYFPTFVDSSNTSSFAPAYQPGPPLGLYLDGRQLTNIYPYDAQGHLLTNVRLYDDRGTPLSGLATQTERGQRLVSSYPTDSTGHVVINAYPQTVNVLPFSGPGAGASAAALVGTQPASGAVAIAGEATVAPPAIAVPPLAAPTPTPAVVLPPLPSPRP